MKHLIPIGHQCLQPKASAIKGIDAKVVIKNNIVEQIEKCFL